MMKLLLYLFMMLFMLIKMKDCLKHMILQNLMLMLFFYFLLNYSLNNFNYWMKIYYNLGMDFYSNGLMLLSLWIISLMMIVSLNFMMLNNNIIYSYVLIFMMMFLFIFFCSMNLMMFYLFFESSLIPIFFLILGWGYQIDRIQAGYYMMLYTLVGSFPLFYMIFYFYKMNFSLMFIIYKELNLNLLLYFMMIMSFLVKMPMYFVHLWLPKAHVEAPVVGSMILAGVMLKLGSYGLLRVMMFFKKSCMNFNLYIMIISLLGGIYSSLICLYQVDMKILVAYSSVVHMSVLLSGMMTLFNMGYYGSILMMISHGLCSSGLFYLVNINYERIMSRSIYINKGLINIFPILTLMWFLLCSSNLSFPPSLNLFSEIMLLSSLIMLSEKFILLLMMILFFSAMYSLYLFSFTQHGLYNNFIFYMKKILINEYMVLLLHWFPLNLLFIYMYMYMI